MRQEHRVVFCKRMDIRSIGIVLSLYKLHRTMFSSQFNPAVAGVVHAFIAIHPYRIESLRLFRRVIQVLVTTHHMVHPFGIVPLGLRIKSPAPYACFCRIDRRREQHLAAFDHHNRIHPGIYAIKNFAVVAVQVRSDIDIAPKVGLQFSIHTSLWV